MLLQPNWASESGIAAHVESRRSRAPETDRDRIARLVEQDVIRIALVVIVAVTGFVAEHLWLCARTSDVIVRGADVLDTGGKAEDLTRSHAPGATPRSVRKHR